MFSRGLRRLPLAFQLRPCLRVAAAHHCILNPSLVFREERTNLENYTAHRFKSYSKQSKDTEEDELESDPTLSRDSKLVKFHSSSMRMDILLKSALSIARNKIEKIFYESKIRLNGKKVMKKSMQIHVGDEIDIIKAPSQKNPEHLYVSRVEIIDAAPGDESIVITARRFKSLLIENYKEDPYKPTSDDNN